MKKSEILRKARQLIEDGDWGFVCFSVRAVLCERSFPNDSITKKNGEELIQYIEEMLEGHLSLRAWIAAKHGYPAEELSTEKLRQTRLNWIDWMIEQLEEQGK